MPGVVVGRDGKKSYYDYDAMKRLTRVQDAAGNSVEYHYDAAGNMTSMIDAMGSQTKWKYDNLNRITQKIYADGTTNNYGYTQGLLTQSQNARGAVTQYLYDDNANLTKIDYQNSPDVTFQYDSLDRLTRMYDAIGQRRFEYDQMSRVTRVSNPWDNDDVFYDYDSLGRRKRINLNDRVENSRPKMRYTYDSLGRLSSLIHEQFASTLTWNYLYAGNSGKVTQLDYPDGSKSTYLYDDMERLTQVQNLDSTGANISKYVYGFDDTGNPQRDVRTYVDKTIGTNPTQRTNFSYDTVNQLLAEVSNETPSPLLNKSYSYDPMGNRLTSTSVTSTSTTSSSYQPNRLNQITGISTSRTGEDDTSSAHIYDADGNLTDVKTGTSSGTTSHTQYVYDDESRLTDVITHDPSTDANVHKSTFTIDGFSRVAIATEFNWNGSKWVQAAQKHYVYDGLNPYIELGDSVNDIEKIMLRGGNGEILAEPIGTNFLGRFYYNDGSGNVSDVVQLYGTHTLLGHYDYDAYGNLTGSSGSDPNVNYYRYSGKEYIPSVGMYNYGYRFYSPGMGRWINRDPIGEAGGLNVYAFVGNNPVNLADAYGLREGDWWDVRTYRLRNFEGGVGEAKNGALAALDGADPFGDPLADKGYYNPCRYKFSHYAGMVGGAAWAGAAGGILAGGSVGAAAVVEAGSGVAIAATPTSGQLGKIIGWGTGQSVEAVEQTINVTRNLTKPQVQEWAKQGLTKGWVEEQLVRYSDSISKGGAKLKNTQLLHRKELMEKILSLWE